LALDYQDGRLSLDGLSLEALAADFGTPLYVYSQAAMIDAAQQVDTALAGPTPHLVCYALKANPSLAVIQTFARLGLGADVTSGGELFRALRAGVPAAKVVFSGVGKTPAELRAALDSGIRALHVETEGELAALNAIAGELGRPAPIALRINPDVDPHTHPKIATGMSENKFGLPWGEVLRIVEDIRKMPGLRLVGLSMHIGSQITRLDGFQEAARLVASLAADLLSAGVALEYLDFGGGIGVRYADETPPSPAEWAGALRAVLGDLPLGLLAEPGRSLVAGSGVLITRVTGIKRTPAKTFVILDAAMNDLIRPMLYDAYHSIDPVLQRPGAPVEPVDIVGPVCETTDTFARGRDLPLPEPGDLLAIRQVGAYGMSMASNYNSRPRAAEVMITADGAALPIRDRETYDDLVRGERLLP